VSGGPQSITKKMGVPFYNVYTKGDPYNIGGCMGCDANATVTKDSKLDKSATFRERTWPPRAYSIGTPSGQ